jgi:S1-C subfamily serine protease
MSLLRHLLIGSALLVALLPPAVAQPPPAWGLPAAEASDRPALGVLVAEIPFEELDSLGLAYGVEVTRVLPGSAAEEAGLRAGDILVEIDGLPIFSVPRLRWLVGQAATDVPLELKYNRDGTASTVKLMPRRAQATPPPSPRWQRQWNRGSPGYLGVKLQPLTPGLREAFEVAKGTGALVAEVYPGSPADKAGLRAGDVIVKMDRRTIHDIDDVQRVVDYFDPGEPVDVEIIRDRKNRTLTVELGESAESRDNGPWRSWQHPGPGSMPFFADPDWWREMEDFMEQWRHYWEESRDENRDRAL